MRKAPSGLPMLLQRLKALFRRPVGVAGAGEEGERLAEVYLRRERGFRTLARNWRNPADTRDELDLVMRDGDVLVFVEVKARASRALVPGYYAVDARKKKVLRRCCGAYLRSTRPRPETFRFDIVEIELPEGRGEPVVRHFENVPLFRKGYRF